MSIKVGGGVVSDTREYPDDAICAHCNHAFGEHDGLFFCGRRSAFPVIDDPANHRFRPVILAGGALSPSREKALYEAALRGEM